MRGKVISFLYLAPVPSPGATGQAEFAEDAEREIFFDFLRGKNQKNHQPCGELMILVILSSSITSLKFINNPSGFFANFR